MQEVQILKVDSSAGIAKPTTDLVAEETPLHIFLNKTHFVTILCTPSCLKEMAVGHMLSEGIIHHSNEIRSVILEEDKQLCRILFGPNTDIRKRIELAKPFSRLITSSCNPSDYWPFSKLIDRIRLPKADSSLVAKAGIISDCVRKLNQAAKTFRKTGGVHVAAICRTDGALIALAEDVGRHNAVDKVIGIGATEDVDFKDVFLALSGRLTGDIVLKAARIGLPLVASKSAAMESGIQVAQHCGITLVGFVRGKRLNIYTYPERVAY